MYFNATKFYSLVFCCALPLLLQAKNEKPTTEAGGLRKPLCFVENKGQLADQDNNLRNDIQYSISTPGMNLFIGNGQMHYQFKKTEGTPISLAQLSFYRMDVTLEGANPSATVVTENELSYYENYFLPQCPDGVTAHAWNKITYKNVYPNIDWVLYVKNNEVEYDFDIHPGGKVSDIQLEYGGASSLSVTENGGITAVTPMGTITEKKPYAYGTDNKEVGASFSLKGNKVTFETSEHKGALTIDPSLLWSTYLGGAAEDVATAVVTDATHNTYVAGYTASAGIATGGAYHAAYLGGAFDAFVGKYNLAGALQFVTYYGGTGTDEGMAVAEDGTGIYLAGYTSSAAGIASFGAHQGALGGGNDGFLVKLNTTGSGRDWATYYGGTGNDAINGIALDGAGNINITGQTASTANISTAGAYKTTLGGTSDAFVAQFNATSGAINWGTYYGGTDEEDGTSIAIGASNNIYITGQTNSVVGIATAGAYQTSLAGTDNAYLAEFNTGGALVWGTYFGGNGTDIGNGISYDPFIGNIAITGSTSSNTGIATANAFQPTFGGLQDAFVAYFTPAGAIKWASYYGGTQLDYGQGVCFDALGNVILAGGTFSTTGIATVNSFQPTIGGDYDAYLAKIDTAGQTLWNTYFGGTFYDYANAVARDANNQIVIAGYTSSTGNYPTGGISTTGAAQTANGGGLYDAFITRFDADTFVVINQPYTDILVCAGGVLNVSYTVFNAGSTFQPTNTFTVQLSNSLGSFTTPVTIGSVTADNSGTIACIIPGGTAIGTGYRIRIVASTPAFTSPDDGVNISVVASISDLSASSNSPVCVGDNIDLYDNPPYTATSYSWAGPIGYTSTLQNPVIPTVTLSNAGTYTVTTTHNGCPATSDMVTVAVNNVIPPTPTITPTSSACAGSSLSLFSNPGAVSGTVTYYWIGPGGWTSTMQNPVITGATTAYSGTYYVQDSLGGCPSLFASETITVMPTTAVSLTISANAPYITDAPRDTICGGTMVNFTAIPVNGGASPTYQWMTGATSPVVGAISGTWSSASLTNAETVFCEMTSNVNCPFPAIAISNVITMNVITNSPLVYIAAYPGIYVSPGSSITFTSAVYDGGINPDYQWTNNGMAIPGATFSTYTLPAVTAWDTIGLTVTSTMACAAPAFGTSNTLIVGTNVGVANISASFENVALFPNPNNGSFTVKGTIENMSNEMVSLEVTDLLGRVMYTDHAAVQNNEINKTMELHDIPGGVYFLSIRQEGVSKVFRFIIQH